MTRTCFTLIGFASLLAWLQTADYLCLARDSSVYNGSVACAAAFALALAAYALASRPNSSAPPWASLVAGAAAGATGVAYALSAEGTLVWMLFCAHLVCVAAVAVLWGAMLARISHRALLPLACVAQLIAIAVLALCIQIASFPAKMAVAALPLLSGICLHMAGRLQTPENADATKAAEAEQMPSISPARTEDGPSPRTSLRIPLLLEPSEDALLPRVSWGFLIVLCPCAFVAGLFNGFVTSPYLTNSSSILASMMVFSALAALVLGVVGFAFIRWQQRADKPDQPLSGEPDLTTQAATGFCIALLVGGLLLFAIQLPSTMSTAISMVLVAKNCLILLCWILFPHANASERLSPEARFALLLLLCGIVVAPFAGSWINKSLSISFQSLSNVATALIALVAVLVVAYMLLRMRLISYQVAQQYATSPTAPVAEAEPQPKPAVAPEPSPQPMSLDDMRDALRMHQQSIMEPYHLTDREREIVTMILDGQTMRGIAETLFISERTVKFHSKNAYDKLGVHNKKELMKMFSELQ